MLLRLPQVKTETGLGRSTIYKRVRDGSFPAPIKTGTRSVAWLSNEVEAWIRERVAESGDRQFQTDTSLGSVLSDVGDLAPQNWTFGRGNSVGRGWPAGPGRPF